MTETTAVPLEIPDEAYAAAREAVCEDGIRGAGAFVTAPDAIRAAAPIVVAAELRRLADEMARRITGDSQTGRPYREAYAVAVAALRVRASELSPEENR